MTVDAAKSEHHGPPTRVGEVLDGRWRLVARLGGGGMGEVYRAEHVNLGRTVAIKVLRQELAGSLSALRVLREGRAASRVVHPNIVRVEDFGVDARGLPYLVQEYLEGVDLEAYATRHRGVVPPEELLPLVIPALDALNALHEAGILHRDIKPENIFVVRDGARWSPRLLDFGLATIVESLGVELRLTASEVTLGSPAYMSPEQFRDPRSLTPQSDLWSFGVMLYELLSGVLPFQGSTVGAVAIMATTEVPVSLGERCPRLPPALVSAVSACLEKRPDDRPASARALMDDLQAVLDGLVPSSSSRPRPSVGSSPRLAQAGTTTEADRAALGETLPTIALAPPPGRGAQRRWMTVLAVLGVGLAALVASMGPRSGSRAPPVTTVSSPRAPTPRPVSEALPSFVVTPPPTAPPALAPNQPIGPTLPPHRLRPSTAAQSSLQPGARDAGTPAALAVAPTAGLPTPPPVLPTVAPTVPAPPAPLGLGIDPQYR